MQHSRPYVFRDGYNVLLLAEHADDDGRRVHFNKIKKETHFGAEKKRVAI